MDLSSSENSYHFPARDYRTLARPSSLDSEAPELDHLVITSITEKGGAGHKKTEERSRETPITTGLSVLDQTSPKSPRNNS